MFWHLLALLTEVVSGAMVLAIILGVIVVFKMFREEDNE